MSDLISRFAVIRMFNEIEGEVLSGDGFQYTKWMTELLELPDAEAIPVSWIEERIINAEDAGQDVLARMWRELVNGYRREHEHKASD